MIPIFFGTLLLLIASVSIQCQQNESALTIGAYLAGSLPQNLCFTPCPMYYMNNLDLNTTSCHEEVHGDILIHTWTETGERFRMRSSFLRGSINVHLEKPLKASGRYYVRGSIQRLGRLQLEAEVTSRCNVSDLGFTIDNFIYLKENSVQCNVTVSSLNPKFENPRATSCGNFVVLSHLKEKISVDLENFFRDRMTNELTCFLANYFKSIRVIDLEYMNLEFYTLPNKTLGELRSPFIAACNTH